MELRTSEVSSLTTSVYDDKDAADRALALRGNHHINRGLADIFANEGTVGVFLWKKKNLDICSKAGNGFTALLPRANKIAVTLQYLFKTLEIRPFS